MGPSINHVDNFLDIFNPPPPLWTILLNKSYVVIWTFGKLPSPCLAHMVYEWPLNKYGSGMPLSVPLKCNAWKMECVCKTSPRRRTLVITLSSWVFFLKRVLLWFFIGPIIQRWNLFLWASKWNIGVGTFRKLPQASVNLRKFQQKCFTT